MRSLAATSSTVKPPPHGTSPEALNYNKTVEAAGASGDQRTGITRTGETPINGTPASSTSTNSTSTDSRLNVPDALTIRVACQCSASNCTCHQPDGNVHCLAHDDTTPSMSVRESSDGKVLVHCHAGCPQDAVIKALQARDAWPSQSAAHPDRTPKSVNKGKASKGKASKKIIGTLSHPYTDKNGKLIFQVVRKEYADGSKNIRQRRPDGNGGWIYGLSEGWYIPHGKNWYLFKGKGATNKDVQPSPDAVWFKAETRRPLYQLLRVMQADHVIVVEGEKSADRLNGELEKLGINNIVATTNPLGAGKWRKEHTEVLAGKQVTVLPDNDTVGRKHTTHICQALNGIAASVKSVDLPGLPEHGDIVDWLNADGTYPELQAIIAHTGEWRHALTTVPRDNISPNEETTHEPTTETTDTCDPPYSAPNMPRHLTDIGNAQRLVEQHGRNLRYCHELGVWFVWNGTRWIPDATAQVMELAKQVAISIYGEASLIKGADEESERRRAAVVAWARASESVGRLKAMIEVARSDRSVLITTAQLDADPMLLNVANGTLDLSTGELRPHRREDYLTKLTPVIYDASARCRTFKKFLIRIMGGNRRLIRFLQRSLGYALTGDTREQVLFIWHGGGANGKSTLINIALRLLGEYGCQTPTETLMAKKNTGGINNDVARLHGARFVSGVETGEGRRLEEVLIKQLTVGDTIAARFLYREFFEFTPRFKLFLATNHKPEVRGTDKAIWRRIRLVPFNVTIPDHEQDRELPGKLSEELSGILNWALQGTRAWQRMGLGEPDEVRAATAEYQVEMDVTQAFIEEVCITGDRMRVKFQDLYATYTRWCEATHEQPLNRKAFGNRLTEKGFRAAHGTGNVALRIGIGLAAAPRDTLADSRADNCDVAGTPVAGTPVAGTPVTDTPVADTQSTAKVNHQPKVNDGYALLPENADGVTAGQNSAQHASQSLTINLPTQLNGSNAACESTVAESAASESTAYESTACESAAAESAASRTLPLGPQTRSVDGDTSIKGYPYSEEGDPYGETDSHDQVSTTEDVGGGADIEGDADVEGGDMEWY